MRLLVLQFVLPQHRPALPEYGQELAVGAALLKGQGAEVALAAMDGYQPEQLHQAINRHRPSHVLVDIPPTRLTPARHAIVEVGEKHFLPVVVVGRYATSRPEQAISIPGVSAVIVGEYERSLSRLLLEPAESPAEAADEADPRAALARPDVPGLWFNGEDGLVRSDPAPLQADLDALPHGDRELFDYQRVVNQTGQAVFFATRGCGHWCSCCLNDWYLELYGEGRYPRRRSVGDVIDEIVEVAGRYKGVRQVVFGDHAFAADADWLGALAEEYPRRCGLPYRCHVRPEQASVRVAGLLARGGCRAVEVEIGSGSNFIREEVLAMPASRQQIVEAVSALAGEGLRVCARVFVGAPYDSDVAEEETLDLLAGLRVDEVQARVFYPVPGTQAEEICRENGWISGRGEENFLAGHSVLDMPSLPAARIDQIARHFPALLKRRSGRSVSSWVDIIRKLSTSPIRRKK